MVKHMQKNNRLQYKLKFSCLQLCSSQNVSILQKALCTIKKKGKKEKAMFSFKDSTKSNTSFQEQDFHL